MNMGLHSKRTFGVVAWHDNPHLKKKNSAISRNATHFQKKVEEAGGADGGFNISLHGLR